MSERRDDAQHGGLQVPQGHGPQAVTPARGGRSDAVDPLPQAHLTAGPRGMKAQVVAAMLLRYPAGMRHAALGALHAQMGNHFVQQVLAELARGEKASAAGVSVDSRGTAANANAKDAGDAGATALGSDEDRLHAQQQAGAAGGSDKANAAAGGAGGVRGSLQQAAQGEAATRAHRATPEAAGLASAHVASGMMGPTSAHRDGLGAADAEAESVAALVAEVAAQLPAYRAARDALNSAEVLRIGAALLVGFRHAAQTAASPADVAALRQLELLLATTLPPRQLRGVDVAEGDGVALPLHGKPLGQQVALLAYEVEQTVGLIHTAQHVHTLLHHAGAGAAPGATTSTSGGLALAQARQLVDAWAGRPIDLAFLRAALGPAWLALEVSSAATGAARPSTAAARAGRNAQVSGWLGDAGSYDPVAAQAALHPVEKGGDAGTIATVQAHLAGETTAAAPAARAASAQVLRDMYSADADSRAHQLTALHVAGKLDDLLDGIGWAEAKALHDSLPNGWGELKSILQPYFLGARKFGPRLDREWQRHDVSLAAQVGKLGVVGKGLNFALDMGTFGFHSAYGQAVDGRANGISSAAEEDRNIDHTVGRTGAMAAASLATGGMADKWVRGGAAVGASVSATRATVAGVAAGSVGGATGLLTADAYNNAIGDQVGLSSLEDYANTAALGGLMGGGLAGAGQVGGKLWAWYEARRGAAAAGGANATGAAGEAQAGVAGEVAPGGKAGAVADLREGMTPATAEALTSELGVRVTLDATGQLVDGGVHATVVADATGRLTLTEIRVAPNALRADVVGHAGLLARLNRYNGLIGELRALWDRCVGRYNPHPPGSAAWRSFEEILKLDGLIRMRQQGRFHQGLVNAATLDAEIAWLTGYRDFHAQQLGQPASAATTTPARTSVIASPEGRWRAALGDEARTLREVADPEGMRPHQQRLPVATEHSPGTPLDVGGTWADANARGNCEWFSDLPEVNAITNHAPVMFKDGYPILEPYVVEHGTVYLKEMLGDPRDFAPADREFARRHGKLKADGTPNQKWAQRYRERNELTWHHHQDLSRMLLLPMALHNNIPHTGGASLARMNRRKAAVGE